MPTYLVSWAVSFALSKMLGVKQADVNTMLAAGTITREQASEVVKAARTGDYTLFLSLFGKGPTESSKAYWVKRSELDQKIQALKDEAKKADTIARLEERLAALKAA